MPRSPGCMRGVGSSWPAVRFVSWCDGDACHHRRATCTCPAMPEHSCTRTVCHEHVQVSCSPCHPGRPLIPTAPRLSTSRWPRSCGLESKRGNCIQIGPCPASLSCSRNSVSHAVPRARGSPCSASRAWSLRSGAAVPSSARHGDRRLKRIEGSLRGATVMHRPRVPPPRTKRTLVRPMARRTASRIACRRRSQKMRRTLTRSAPAASPTDSRSRRNNGGNVGRRIARRGTAPARPVPELARQKKEDAAHDGESRAISAPALSRAPRSTRELTADGGQSEFMAVADVG